MQTLRRIPVAHARPHVGQRAGYIAPILALLLCVMLGGLALMLDRLWLDMAHEEAQNAAEMTALAAARELASDDLLRVPTNSLNSIERCQETAIEIASRHQVAGIPVSLDPQADLKVGVLVPDETSGLETFLETNHASRSVQVLISRTSAGGNPVSRFLTGLTHQGGADVRAAAEATLDDRVVGVQTLAGVSAPVLPIAVLLDAPVATASALATGTPPAIPCWKRDILERQGTDLWGYDTNTGTVTAGPDGIPEIVLTTTAAGADPTTSNVAFLHLTGNAHDDPLDRQIRHGWNDADLQHDQGRFLISQGPRRITGRTVIGAGSEAALREVVGQNRIICLYQRLLPGSGTWHNLEIVGLAAGRILKVNHLEGQIRQLVLQPAVLATRHAVTVTDIETDSLQTPPNPTIFKLKLTQ